MLFDEALGHHEHMAVVRCQFCLGHEEWLQHQACPKDVHSLMTVCDDIDWSTIHACLLIFLFSLQILMAAVLSLAYGAINGHTTFGIFALMRNIKDTAQVARTSSIGMELRCVSAVGLTLGAVLFGARVVPVTGEVQHADG